MRKRRFCVKVFIYLVILFGIFWWATDKRLQEISQAESLQISGYSQAFQSQASVIKEQENQELPRGMQLRWLIYLVQSADAAELKNTCLELMSAFSEWNVLLIGEYDQFDRCFFLRKQDILKAPVFESEHIDRVKVAAYMYVIQRGAEWVYVPPTDFSPPFSMPNFVMDNTYTGNVLRSHSSRVFNVEEYITNDFESDIINKTMDYEHCHELPTPAIQTTVSVRSPMLEGVKPANACSPWSINVTLASSVFLQTDFTDTLFHKDAFWALPFFHSEFLSDQFLHNWYAVTQRLLWDSGNMIYVSLRTEPVNALPPSSWEASKTKLLDSFPNRTMNFTTRVKLLLQGHNAFCHMVIEWLELLSNRGCKLPHLSNTKRYFESCERANPIVVNGYFSEGLLCRTCHRSVPHNISPNRQFKRVLLVVVFNYGHYEVIPYLEILYRSHFPSILYCGPDPMRTKSFPQLAKYRISVVSHGSRGGYLSYKCAILALDMEYDVDGYLFIGDDVLLNIEPFRVLMDSNFDKVWFVDQALYFQNLEAKDRYFNRKFQFHSSLEWLRKFPWRGPIGSRCKSSEKLTAYAAVSDIYYVPRSLMQEFSIFVTVFLEYDIFVEFAVPTALRCLAAVKDIQIIKHDAIDSTRWELFQYRNKSEMHSFHPVKWGNLQKGKSNETHIFCEEVVPRLLG